MRTTTWSLHRACKAFFISLYFFISFAWLKVSESHLCMPFHPDFYEISAGSHWVYQTHLPWSWFIFLSFGLYIYIYFCVIIVFTAFFLLKIFSPIGFSFQYLLTRLTLTVLNKLCWPNKLNCFMRRQKDANGVFLSPRCFSLPLSFAGPAAHSSLCALKPLALATLFSCERNWKCAILQRCRVLWN